jgi:hypothetical protein
MLLLPHLIGEAVRDKHHSGRDQPYYNFSPANLTGYFLGIGPSKDGGTISRDRRFNVDA